MRDRIYIEIWTCISNPDRRVLKCFLARQSAIDVTRSHYFLPPPSVILTSEHHITLSQSGLDTFCYLLLSHRSTVSKPQKLLRTNKKLDLRLKRTPQHAGKQILDLGRQHVVRCDSSHVARRQEW